VSIHQPESPPTAIRVVIVEDHALLREGLGALLSENGIEVVATAEDGPGLLRIVAGHKPDLAICDVRLPPTFTDEGIKAALEARRRLPSLALLVLSQYVLRRAPGVRGVRRRLPAQGAGLGGSYLCRGGSSSRGGRHGARP
jgi:CheY-like chemotaxis protein